MPLVLSPAPSAAEMRYASVLPPLARVAGRPVRGRWWRCSSVPVRWRCGMPAVCPYRKRYLARAELAEGPRPRLQPGRHGHAISFFHLREFVRMVWKDVILSGNARQRILRRAVL